MYVRLEKLIPFGRAIRHASHIDWASVSVARAGHAAVSGQRTCAHDHTHARSLTHPPLVLALTIATTASAAAPTAATAIATAIATLPSVLCVNL